MKQHTILVVDDDRDGADGLSEALEFYGHKVTTVYGGEDAVKAFRQEEFDLTFMDVMMLGLNGVECFLEIRKIKPDAKVYMMTGFSARDLLEEAVGQGAAGVFHKPFAIEDVIEKAMGS
ncbi:MAG: response regulator [Hyphomicrobiales bacterium]